MHCFNSIFKYIALYCFKSIFKSIVLYFFFSFCESIALIQSCFKSIFKKILNLIFTVLNFFNSVFSGCIFCFVLFVIFMPSHPYSYLTGWTELVNSDMVKNCPLQECAIFLELRLIIGCKKYYIWFCVPYQVKIRISPRSCRIRQYQFWF